MRIIPGSWVGSTHPYYSIRNAPAAVLGGVLAAEIEIMIDA